MMRKTLFSGICILLLGHGLTVAQDAKPESKVSFNYNVDFVSRYVWRGLLFNGNPNIQPTVSLTAGGLTIGSWASYGMSQNYAEIDLFASYSFSNFSITLYDYYNENETDLAAVDYFNWDKNTTGHLLEGTVAWLGTENFPLSMTLAAFFYGYDTDANGDQNYSTYLELGYPVNIGNYKLNFFLGGTLNDGFYHTDPNIVNVGFKTTKEIEISDRFKLPVSATFVVNPAKDDVFFVVGITL